MCSFLDGTSLGRHPTGFRGVSGGRYRTRTDDLFRVKEARYQLRQSPCCDNPATGCRPARNAIGSGRSHQLQSSSTQKCGQCGCGAVVAHHLAKVRVASSNLVIRSSEVSRFSNLEPHTWWRGREARQRPAKPCTRVRIPSPPHSPQPVHAVSEQATGDWRSGSALP